MNDTRTVPRCRCGRFVTRGVDATSCRFCRRLAATRPVVVERDELTCLDCGLVLDAGVWTLAAARAHARELRHSVYSFPRIRRIRRVPLDRPDNAPAALLEAA